MHNFLLINIPLLLLLANSQSAPTHHLTYILLIYYNCHIHLRAHGASGDTNMFKYEIFTALSISISVSPQAGCHRAASARLTCVTCSSGSYPCHGIYESQAALGTRVAPRRRTVASFTSQCESRTVH